MTTAFVSRRRSLRAAAWLMFLGLVLVRIAVAASPLSPSMRLLISDSLTYLSPMVLAVALGAYLALSTLGRGREHQFWGLLTLATTPVLIAETYWTWYAVMVDVRGPLDSSVIRLLHFLAAAFVFILLVQMTRFGSLPRVARLRLHFDVLSVLIVAWPFVYLFVTLPAVGPLPGGGSVAAAFEAVYPLLGVAMIAATTSIALDAGRHRPVWERLIALALFLYGLSLCFHPLFFVMALTVTTQGPDFLTLALGFGYHLLVVGMIYRLTAERAEISDEPWRLPELSSTRLLHYLPVLTASALPVMGGYAFFRAESIAGPSLRIASVVLAVVLVVRSWIAAIERAGVRATATTDPATGAFNRALLDVRLVELLEYAAESGRPVSLVIFDIRDFMRAGEATWRTSDESAAGFVRVLREQSPRTAEVFRSGGDRLAVILEGLGSAEASAYALRVWLTAGRGRAVSLADFSLGIGAGIASFPEHALTGPKLLVAAEIAVTVARGAEGEPVAVYEEGAASVSAEERHAGERMRVLRGTVRALAEAVDARDPATRDHSVNVAELATALAQVVDLPDRQVQVVGLAALMHDVGKIGVRDEILLKPSLLEADERAQVEEHPLLGERILAPARLNDVLPLVRWHHERWDGAGYPDGLAGDEIPIGARILAVCDAFETLTTGRPYREALSIDETLDELEEAAGSQFDPALTAAFSRMIRGLSGPESLRASR